MRHWPASLAQPCQKHRGLLPRWWPPQKWGPRRCPSSQRVSGGVKRPRQRWGLPRWRHPRQLRSRLRLLRLRLWSYLWLPRLRQRPANLPHLVLCPQWLSRLPTCPNWSCRERRLLLCPQRMRCQGPTGLRPARPRQCRSPLRALRFRRCRRAKPQVRLRALHLWCCSAPQWVARAGVAAPNVHAATPAAIVAAPRPVSAAAAMTGSPELPEQIVRAESVTVTSRGVVLSTPDTGVPVPVVPAAPVTAWVAASPGAVVPAPHSAAMASAATATAAPTAPGTASPNPAAPPHEPFLLPAPTTELLSRAASPSASSAPAAELGNLQWDSGLLPSGNSGGRSAFHAPRRHSFFASASIILASAGLAVLLAVIGMRVFDSAFAGGSAPDVSARGAARCDSAVAGARRFKWRSSTRAINPGC